MKFITWPTRRLVGQVKCVIGKIIAKAEKIVNESFEYMTLFGTTFLSSNGNL